MRMESFTRFILFCIFFVFGLGAFSLSILCEDIRLYYSSKEDMNNVQASLETLAMLDEDYEALLERIESDPELLQQVIDSTFGNVEQDSNIARPRTNAEQLAAVKEALLKSSDSQNTNGGVPKYLERITDPRMRLALLLAGASLIITAFIFFGPVGRADLRDSEIED